MENILDGEEVPTVTTNKDGEKEMLFWALYKPTLKDLLVALNANFPQLKIGIPNDAKNIKMLPGVGNVIFTGKTTNH